MEEKLIERLKDLGYEYSADADASLLSFCKELADNRIKNRINHTVIPSELEQIEIDMICGEFLHLKKSTGQLTSYQLEQVVQSIKEGDTQVSFLGGSTPEQQFDSMVDSMMNGSNEDLIRFRRLVW